MFGNIAPSKVVVVDWGVILHKAVFSYHRQSKISNIVSRPERIMCMILLASLRHVGLQKNDTVIIAVDSPKNWRKEVDPMYKANRKEAREKTGIDWTNMFDRSNKILENIDKSSPFHIVKVPTLEADDIIATAVKKYSDRDVIAITIDSDFYQLFSYSNFKFFSLNTKKYKKPLKNPYNELNKKIKSEPTDNLTSPITNKVEYDKRKMLVNLITLPDFVEKKASEALDILKPKCYTLDTLFWGDEKIKSQYDKIWNSGIDYYDCIKPTKKYQSTKIKPLF